MSCGIHACSDVNVPPANAAFKSAIVAVSMFSPAARAGTYNAPASAHDATAEYSTRFMRIAISISPAVSRRRPIGLGVVSCRAMGVPIRRDRPNGQLGKMNHISAHPGPPSKSASLNPPSTRAGRYPVQVGNPEMWPLCRWNSSSSEDYAVIKTSDQPYLVQRRFLNAWRLIRTYPPLPRYAAPSAVLCTLV